MASHFIFTCIAFFDFIAVLKNELLLPFSLKEPEAQKSPMTRPGLCNWQGAPSTPAPAFCISPRSVLLPSLVLPLKRCLWPDVVDMSIIHVFTIGAHVKTLTVTLVATRIPSLQFSFCDQFCFLCISSSFPFTGFCLHGYYPQKHEGRVE